MDQLLADSDISYLLLVLDVSDDDKGLDPREEVLGVEDDSQLLNSKSIVLNSCPEVTKVNQILQELTGKNQRGINVLALDIRTTLIDKAARKEQIFAIAFLTLYPNGLADFNQACSWSVTLKEYAYYLMRYEDGRFGQHLQWRFIVFNILMRNKSKKLAQYYVLKLSNLSNLT